MIRRIISIMVVTFMLINLYGCTCCTKLSVNEIENQPEGKIEQVVLLSGETVKFDEDGGKLDAEKNIVKGYVDDESLYGKMFEYNYTDIKEVHYRQISTKKSILAVGIASLGLAAIVLGWGNKFND